MNSSDPRLLAIPDVHGHAKGEHKPYAEERPIALSARMLFLWFFHACRRGWPRFLMVADHMNYLTFEDPAAVNLVRRALKLAQAGDLYGAADTASVDVGHAAVVSEGLRRGMRYSIGAEVDNDPRCRPDAQNIVDAMKPDGMIRSVHFLPIDHPTHGPNWLWPFDNPEFIEFYDTIGIERVWEIYMVTLLDAIERLPGHIVGHFYVPSKFGHWPSDEILEGHEDRFIEALAAREMAVEFNSRLFYRNDDEAAREAYRRANVRLLRKAKAAGVGIAVGSDAHSPRDQGEAFDHVLAALDEAEINELVFPIGGRLARVALRVVREAAPETAVPAEPSRAAVSVAAHPGDDVDVSGDPPLATGVTADAGAAGTTAAAAPGKRRPPRRKAKAAVLTEEPASAPIVTENVSEPVATPVAPATSEDVAGESAAAESAEADTAAVDAATPAVAARPEPAGASPASPGTHDERGSATEPALAAAAVMNEPGDAIVAAPMPVHSEQEPPVEPATAEPAQAVRTSEPPSAPVRAVHARPAQKAAASAKKPAAKRRAEPSRSTGRVAAKPSRPAAKKESPPARSAAKKAPAKKSRPVAAAPSRKAAKPAVKKAAPKAAPKRSTAKPPAKKTAAKKPAAKKSAPKRTR